MLDLVDEAMDIRRRRLLDRPVLPDQCRRRHRRGRAASPPASPTMAASTPPTCATRWTRSSTRSTRRSPPPARAEDPARHLPPQVRRHPRNWGRTKETLPMIEAAAHAPARRARRLSLYRRLDQPPRWTSSPTDYPDHDRLVDAPSRDGRPRPRRHRGGLGRRPPRGRRAGSIPPARSTSRWTRTTSAASCASRSTMIGSDGLPHDAHPHPRLWGTFPRVIGHYARD